MAAGLLGGGSRFLGVTEDTARFLAGMLSTVAGKFPKTDEQWDELARLAVTEQRAAGRFVPGLGHPVHKRVDPRNAVIIELADRGGLVQQRLIGERWNDPSVLAQQVRALLRHSQTK